MDKGIKLFISLVLCLCRHDFEKDWGSIGSNISASTDYTDFHGLKGDTQSDYMDKENISRKLTITIGIEIRVIREIRGLFISFKSYMILSCKTLLNKYSYLLYYLYHGI